MQLTGGEIVVESLIQAGVPYIAGIPGHGCLALVDALRRHQEQLPVIQVRHEQSAVHLADGFFRITGKPMAVFTSIGPGAVNTAVGVATAYVDSSALLVLTSNVHTYMRGAGVLQEIERVRWADFPRILEPVVKQYWSITRVEQLPRVMARAFNIMTSGRPGPVLVDLPMDIQADSIDVTLPQSAKRKASGVIQPDPAEVEKAAKLLWSARRPVILVGGGVVLARAEQELRKIAEYLGAAVITTMMGKGAFPENHPLYAWHAGSKGTTCGNKLAASADVLLAVGCRFADEATCSYRAGISFSIPPTRLVHVDIDPGEIGKNYPVEVGIVSDAYSFLGALLKALKDLGYPRDWINSTYTTEILKLKENWFTQIAPLAESNQLPMTISRALREIRACLPDETIVVTSSGHTQAQVFQEFPFLLPRTNITTGGFSTMGWAVPAALGCKLGSPGQPVVAMVGDGDFLMSMHELATAKQYNIPILVIIFNNYGWHSIKDLQIDAYGPEQEYVTRFLDLQGQPYSPNFAEVGRAFGVHALRVERPGEIQPVVKKALEQGGPAIIEVIVAQDHSWSGGVVAGWWDVPVPTYLTERRTAYERSRDEEIL